MKKTNYYCLKTYAMLLSLLLATELEAGHKPDVSKLLINLKVF